MNHPNSLVIVIGTVLVVGCATAERRAMSSHEDDPTFITGSRIPVRTGSRNPDVKTMSNKSDIDQMLHKGGTATGGVLGEGGS